MVELPDEIRTTPSGIRIHFNPRNHRYKIGRDADAMSFVPSVSTILGDTIPKNLSGWAERGAVEGCLAVLEEGWLPDAEEVLARMEKRGLRHWQRRDAAADRGTSVHSAFEILGEGRVPKLSGFAPSQRGYVRAVCKWWADAEPVVLENELIVASMAHGYAGRLDLYCELDGVPTIVDLKTSSGVRESHHFQLAGYEVALSESGYGDVDAKAVLRVDNDGEYEYVESWATTGQFLALLDSYSAQKQFKTDTPEAHKYWKKKKAA
jgi:hypothetical protein